MKDLVWLLNGSYTNGSLASKAKPTASVIEWSARE
jgi:hypothetical protein